MAKRKRTKGGADAPVLTKQEVLADPKIKQALQAFVAQQGGGAKMRQIGGGWWDDFVGWLKKNKVISIASKIGSAIANATGFVPLGAALAGVSGTASALGYGRGMMRISRPRMRGMGINDATPIAYNNTASANAELKF